MNKPKVAWLHKADDHYLSDESYHKELKAHAANAKAVKPSYLKFIEYTAYEALLKERDELKKDISAIYAAQNG